MILNMIVFVLLAVSIPAAFLAIAELAVKLPIINKAFDWFEKLIWG